MSTEITAFLERLFGESFPELSCLRCKHQEFFILSPLTQKLDNVDRAELFLPTNEESFIQLKNYVGEDAEQDMARAFTRSATSRWFAELVCKRCGHTERHFLPILIAATKPVTESVDGG